MVCYYDLFTLRKFIEFLEKQSLHMVQHHHVYMLRSGRISMCGVTPSNVEYVAQAINETLTNVK